MDMAVLGVNHSRRLVREASSKLVGHGVAMIACGKRANSALTAHDHGSAVEGVPAPDFL